MSTTLSFSRFKAISNPPKQTSGAVANGEYDLYFNKADGKLYIQQPDGTNLVVGSTTPATNTNTSGGQVPNTNGTTPNTSAPTSVYQDGSVVFAPTALASWNASSPLSVGGSTCTFNGSSEFEFLLAGVTGQQMGPEKDLSTNKVRVMRFTLRVDATATISNENSFLHFWTDGYAKNLMQLRFVPGFTGSTKYRLKLNRAFDTTGKAIPLVTGQDYETSNVEFTKGTNYTLELHMSDGAWSLIDKTGGANKIIHRRYGLDYGTTPTYIGGVHLGEFFSGNMSGKYYVKNISFLQDYVYPIKPAALTDRVLGAYTGFKNSYLRTDGAVVRPNPDGYNGLYQPWSDVVSEGIAYAALYAVTLNDQTAFDTIYSFYNTYLKRSTTYQGSLSYSPNLMGWLWNELAMVKYDANYATDADIDFGHALVWAAKRKARGDSGWVGSSINYGTAATNIITDLKTNNLRTIGSKKYFTSDAFQFSTNPFETNPSYVSTCAMKVFRDFTADTTWDQALDGAYEQLTTATTAILTDTTGTNRTGKLPPNWAFFNNSGVIDTTKNNGSRTTDMTYDAFRVIPRVYWHYKLFNDTRAQTYLALLYNFYKSEWDNNASIKAEYYHDGAVKGAYEKTMMTFNAYFVFLANGDTTRANAVWQNKIKDDLTYKQHPHGDFIADNAAQTGVYQGQPGYFGESWGLFGMMLVSGQFQNIV